MLLTLKIQGLYDIFITCILVIILLYLFSRKYKKTNNMSGHKRPISPRIPSNLDLPPLSTTIQQEYTPPAPQQNTSQETQVRAHVEDSSVNKEQKAVESSPVEEQDYDIPESAEQIEERNTYYQVGTEKTGTLEFDLISHRQRGVEKRYLNVQVRGLILGKEKKEIGDCRMHITSKEQFEELKSFFAHLNWED